MEVAAMQSCLDKIGRPIQVGCYIAYGHALGRCAGLRIGLVLNIKEPSPEGTNSWEAKGWRITVIGIDDDWEHRPIEILSRKGTLQFPNRILVLDDVPEAYQTIFSNYKE
jgi:hypothetical protein